jgi:hypothetical protein
MSALCRSYHFQMPAPPAMYFVSQRFTLERNLHQSDAEQQDAFTEHYRVNGAYVGGKDEAGGPVAHLYARDLPATADNRVYAYTRVRERQPGSTALAGGLAALTAGLLWFFFLTWESLVSGDTQGIDVASLVLALLALWFSSVFREEVETRIPLVSRFGLLLAGASLVYSLLTILLRPAACDSSLPNCSSSTTGVFSRSGLLVCAVVVSLVVVWLLVRRYTIQREYSELQKAAVERYMS